MKNQILLLIIALFVLCSCEQKRPPDRFLQGISDEVVPTEYSFTLPQTTERQDQFGELRVNIPELDMEGQEIYYIGRGYYDRENSSDYRAREIVVYVVADKKSYDFYMVVAKGDKFITHYLGNDPLADSQGMVACADIDGDGDDEIVLNMEISGTRCTLAHIYKIKNDSIELMEDLDEWEDINTSRYGYTYEFLENCKLKIENIYTGYSVVQDISHFFIKDFFDEAGKPTYGNVVYFRTFESRVVVDIDNYKRITLRYFQQVRGEAYFGYTVTTLKYNQQTKDFDVIDTEYIEDQYMYNW
ncbi:MAG: hypothetical protein HFE78_05135 [Clostridiales bacterium]|nr:hypothetical protein [Clostridiales bacterium]